MQLFRATAPRGIAALPSSSALPWRLAPEQGTRPDTGHRTCKLRLPARPPAPVSAASSRAPCGDILAVDEIVEQFIFGDLIRCFVVMLDQLTHGPEIGFSGTFPPAVNLHGFFH